MKFSGLLSLRRIPNETLKRDESFIEIVEEKAKGEKETSCETRNFTINEVLSLSSEKAKRLVSQCSVFS